MRINPIKSNINFGNKAVATCRVEKRHEKGKDKAVIYKISRKDHADLSEILYNDTTCTTACSFLKGCSSYEGFLQNSLYVIRKTSTKEPVSCAKTSKYYSRVPDYEGPCYSIDVCGENKGYKNAVMPLIKYFVNLAHDGIQANVVIRPEAAAKLNLKKYKFIKAQDGAMYLPASKYEEFLKNTDNEISLKETE